MTHGDCPRQAGIYQVMLNGRHLQHYWAAMQVVKWNQPELLNLAQAYGMNPTQVLLTAAASQGFRAGIVASPGSSAILTTLVYGGPLLSTIVRLPGTAACSAIATSWTGGGSPSKWVSRFVVSGISYSPTYFTLFSFTAKYSTWKQHLQLVQF